MAAAAHAADTYFATDFGRSITRSFSLPVEISLMVFLALDLRSLTQCVFVCTSWYSFISKEKRLWLRPLSTITHLPVRIVTSAVEQYHLTSFKSPVRRSGQISIELQQSTQAVAPVLPTRSEDSEEVLKLAMLQHQAVLHRVFSSICWLKKKENQVNDRPSRHITLVASRKTPLKVGRHTVLLKDSPVGPFTFYQLDSASSQLVQVEYQVPHNFDASTHVMEFLPGETEESSPYAGLLVCLVRQRVHSAAVPTTSRGPSGVVTRILWYDTDSLSIAAQCDVKSLLCKEDTCIFCQYCGLVAFLGCDQPSKFYGRCKSPRVTVWSPYTPGESLDMAVTPFCPPLLDKHECSKGLLQSFLAGRQEGAYTEVSAGTRSGICSSHRIIQLLNETEL